MTAINWLCANAPGFAELPTVEREAIMHFSLLWGLYEDKALNNAASANAIAAAVQHCVDAGSFQADQYGPHLAYFSQRYFQQGQPTLRYAHLHLRPNDQPELVRAVLTGVDTDPAKCATVCLIVVYRFRNNLFHGYKWAYQLQDQLENFTHANDILMLSLQMHGVGI